ncbi:MAG: 3-oxoacyl-[acyl-carrier-protein] reductase [Deltaproteobacteria bacterium]|uniref:3-oxoacyl-[acyl-carrier-protein] reductase n=1 Tax=Candidatus Zymogenus saltonus TaxID=2844893 RepID=A0A9D8KFL4_9DELT|nr:3-oxoacyl-[acyl-carrier-protein] reductase [Candidatus Zymogenus saltonus]
MSPKTPGDFDFSGRTALITGGSKGIGRAVSLALAERGADVIINYSADDDAAKGVVSEIEAMGRKATAIKADVSDTAKVEDMFGIIRKDPGRLDILVNNAGIIRDKLLMFMNEDDWNRVIDINLKGVYNCCKTAIRFMIGEKYGKIINMVSPSAILGRAGQTNYASSKGGVIGFTRSLAQELARFNICVNAVSPGLIETEMMDNLTEETKKELLSAVPLGRLGTPEEVTGAVLFLASDKSDYITGQVISVDGGLT